MDNENTVQTDQAEAVETSNAFDDGWDDRDETVLTDDGQDDGWGSDEDDRETEEESGETDADADQQAADEPNGEDTDGNATEDKAEGEAASPDQGESFELRYLGENRTVNRDEVVKLAQQGMDYPRIREKWDSVKDDVPRLRMYESFLKELAESRGGDINALIDETRTRSLMAKAEAEGKKLSASAAAAQAVQARMKAMEPEAEKQQKDSEEEQQAKRRASVDRFLSIYGNSIKSEDIPKEVWDDAEKIGDLTTAYQRYKNSELESENKRLKDEIEQAKQQQKNKERSMGSSRSVGKAATRDAFDEGWNDL